MSNLPAVCIVTDAARDNANLVWKAMGRGPDTFSRAVCAVDPEATPATPATHWLMADGSADSSDVAAWQAMAHGDLPQIEGIWGEDEVIDAAAAQEAVSAANLQVYSASGDVVPLSHIAGIFVGRGLQFVPDDPA